MSTPTTDNKNVSVPLWTEYPSFTPQATHESPLVRSILRDQQRDQDKENVDTPKSVGGGIAGVKRKAAGTPLLISSGLRLKRQALGVKYDQNGSPAKSLFPSTPLAQKVESRGGGFMSEQHRPTRLQNEAQINTDDIERPTRGLARSQSSNIINAILAGGAVNTELGACQSPTNESTTTTNELPPSAANASSPRPSPNTAVPAPASVSDILAKMSALESRIVNLESSQAQLTNQVNTLTQKNAILAQQNEMLEQVVVDYKHRYLQRLDVQVKELIELSQFQQH